jgi:phenylalanyl-tRNA synthetase alpha chain
VQDQVAALKRQFQEELAQVSDSLGLERLRVKYLGKKGPIQELLLGLRQVAPEERPVLGKWINDLKVEMTSLCDSALHSFSSIEQAERIAQERIDVTMPGRRRFLGCKHPIRLMMDEVLSLFIGMGFSVQYGPDIDTDFYNFEGLNFPPDHPAREMQDTFYLAPDVLLRTHTSNTQLRVMETHRPPIRIVAPGTCFRNETVSPRSHVFFHQVEGIYIDEGVTFADLFATMRAFLCALFRAPVETRFRASFFPFVEPGVEVDVRCLACQGEGCRLCKQSGWLEIVGAGMIHPAVLKNGAIDPERYTGFAWGFGIERLAMLRYGIKDIRTFTENDMRFLAQFAGASDA